MIHLELYFADSFSFLLFTSDYVKGDDLIVIDVITRFASFIRSIDPSIESPFWHRILFLR